MNNFSLREFLFIPIPNIFALKCPSSVIKFDKKFSTMFNCLKKNLYCNLNKNVENVIRCLQFSNNSTTDLITQICEIPQLKFDYSRAENIVKNGKTFLNLEVGRENEELNFLKSHIGNYNYHEVFDNNFTKVCKLIILLLSKLAGPSHSIVCDGENDILCRQNALAEVTHMIGMFYLCHKNLPNSLINQKIKEKSQDLGSKIKLLAGDYFLSRAFEKLARIKNQTLMCLISSITRDIAEAEFLINHRDNEFISELLTSTTDFPVEIWKKQNTLSVGSLLGKSCQGTLYLAGHSQKIQMQGLKFGKHLAIAWQAWTNLQQLKNHKGNTQFNLFSVPILFHITENPSILRELCNSTSSVNNSRLRVAILNGPGFELTRQLHRKHYNEAFEILRYFQKNDASLALKDILNATNDF